MVRQIVIAIIFLASATFFYIIFLPRGLILLLSFACTALVVVTVLLASIYDYGKRFNPNFSPGVILILLSTFLGMLGAYIGHDQGFLLSFWVSSPMLLYFFYFFLHTTRVRPEELERLLIAMAVLWMAIWILQWAIFPTKLFDVRVESSRGTVRVFLPGRAFAALMYFYFLQMFFKTNKLKYTVFILGYIIITLLSGTRSSILPLLLITIINLLYSKRVKSRLLISFFITVSIIMVFFIFQDMIMGLVEISQEQASQEEEDVRSRSTRFYLTEFYPNKINYAIGNGASHMANAYGLKVMYYQTVYGYYLSDIGIIGDYVKYGIFYLIGVFVIFRKLFIAKIEPKYNYFKYYGLLLILDEILGGAFGRPTSFIVVLTMLYIMDVSSYLLTHGEHESD